ncbi:MAG TPA: cyanophycin synthetase, partial [Prolixibacteraceae bacterium]|nr:cyanophycin synthetase [Prolixibacteraceae bacterium]
IGTTQPGISHVFKEKAEIENTPLFFADQEFRVEYALRSLTGNQILSVSQLGEKILPGLDLDLLGNYQQKNIPAVLKTCQLLNHKGFNIRDKHLYEGLADAAQLTGLKGRWQVVGNNPQIVCDTGHNEDGIREIVRQIKQVPYKNLHIVFGMVNDKDPDKILKLLPKNAFYYFTKANISRSLDENILAKKAVDYGLKSNAFSNVQCALNAAKNKAGKNDFIFVGGSTFVVAEILEDLQ